MRKSSISNISRRRLLAAAAVAPFGLVLPRVTVAAPAPARTLSFYHLHTHEQLEVTYYAGGEYVAGALAEIDRVLRDHRTGEVAAIDLALLDTLHCVASACDCRTFQVICGFRSAATNGTLADRSSGVARNSLHMQGRAIDIRVPGYDTGTLRNVCVALGLGGVGYYPRSDFVHLDTGRVRTWGPPAG